MKTMKITKPVAYCGQHITTHDWKVVEAIREFCGKNDLVKPTVINSLFGYELAMNCSYEQANTIDKIIYCIKFGYDYSEFMERNRNNK